MTAFTSPGTTTHVGRNCTYSCTQAHVDTALLLILRTKGESMIKPLDSSTGEHKCQWGMMPRSRKTPPPVVRGQTQDCELGDESMGLLMLFARLWKVPTLPNVFADTQTQTHDLVRNKKEIQDTNTPHKLRILSFCISTQQSFN